MSRIAISCEGIGKEYRIGQRESYKALRDVLSNSIASPFRRLRSMLQPSAEIDVDKGANTFWSLKDITFNIASGEVVGVIGRNGAGKSTLLKILSRITKPTEGYAEIHGRVGSLLEVGTGFNPELSGRENIFLNGAILGMKKVEIDRKFDDIVAFAEVEKFIDTPVKRYSSGMYVRLAFAVAAHMDPEILVVDEVLAVGDANFQKKCLGKLGDVAEGGRTVLFVSHQMSQIRRFCHKCIWLDGGHLVAMGPTAEVVSAYEGALESGRTAGNRTNLTAQFNNMDFLKWEFAESHSKHPHMLVTTGETTVRFVVNVAKDIHSGFFFIHLYNKDRQLVWSMEMPNFKIKKGHHSLFCKLPSLPLRPAAYTWHIEIHHDMKEDVYDLTPDLVVATRPATFARDDQSGILNVPCEMQIEEEQELHLLAQSYG